MDEPTTGAETSAPENIPIPADAPERMSAREAAQILASYRKPREAVTPSEMNQSARDMAASIAAQESEPPPGRLEGDDAAPPQEASGETQVAEAETPPIEPPRSWTKDARERWAALPRETQEYLAERERDRDRELNLRQQEAAEQRKAMDAERQRVEQARQQYEAALPAVLQQLQHSAGQFADLKSDADIAKLAAEDWPRYLQWTEHQRQLGAVQKQMEEAQIRRVQEFQQQWDKFAKEQDELFRKAVPEMADPKKAAELQTSAVSMLKDIGFTDDELNKSYHGQLGVSIRDHRFQELIHDAMSWREAKAKAKTVVENKKPVPPVQRPGAAPSKGATQAQELQNLEKQLDNASGVNALRIAARLQHVRRAAR